MVYRNFKKALNLIGMEVHRHDPGSTGGHEEVGHQLGAYRNAWLALAVLAGPSKVGHNGRDVLGRSPFSGINEEQELHEVGVWLVGRTHEENPATPHGFFKGRLKLAIAELGNINGSQRLTISLGNALSQVHVGPGGKYFRSGCSHLGSKYLKFGGLLPSKTGLQM